MKKLCIFLISVLLFTSCSDDDNENNGKTYRLHTFTISSILTEPEIYDNSGITWKFNFEAQTISVNNNENEFILLEDGNYNYTLFDHQCGFDENKGMMVDGNYLGIFISESNNGYNIITLTDACLDGHIAVFRRGLIL